MSKPNLLRAKSELSFLCDYMGMPRFRDDLAIEFRGPSELSVYDRGFRLAQVRFMRDGAYRVTTHTKFIERTPLADQERYPRVGGLKDYAVFDCTRDTIHHLLQAKHIMAMRPRIKEIPHREEIGVSHVIAADNARGSDVVVIDREVGDSATEHRGERLDLLALQEASAGRYRFLAIEVKLGNNPELDIETRKRRDARSAVEQVLGYRDQIDRYFEEYARCYRENIAQKLELGLLRAIRFLSTMLSMGSGGRCVSNRVEDAGCSRVWRDPSCFMRTSRWPGERGSSSGRTTGFGLRWRETAQDNGRRDPLSGP